MTRNGKTIPFPKELITPPIWSSHTWRGSCGSSLLSTPPAIPGRYRSQHRIQNSARLGSNIGR